MDEKEIVINWAFVADFLYHHWVAGAGDDAGIRTSWGWGVHNKEDHSPELDTGGHILKVQQHSAADLNVF